MKFSKKLLTVLIIPCAVVFFAACSNSDTNEASMAKIAVKLTDAPGDYTEVNIDVQDVLIKRDNEDGEHGWESVGIDSIAGVYNLLELTGGVSVLLVDTQVPSGKINQIRLLLGDNNTVVKGNDTVALKTPSAQQSGLKLKLNDSLQAGYAYTFTLDFDVDKSIVAKGNGEYNLKPVIRVSSEISSGTITGNVIPANVQVMASVEIDGEIVSAYTNDEGVFMLYGIPEGTYTLTLTPDEASGLAVKTIDGVQVTNGDTTQLGEISLE